MFLLIFNCGALFGIVWLFERKRIDMDNFSAADLFVFPCIVLLVPVLLGLFVRLPAWLPLVTTILFLCVTFWVCWKQIPTTRARAACYSIILLAANIAVELALTYGQRA
jgi:cbb3-type cytochrome oxidase subunit 3